LLLEKNAAMKVLISLPCWCLLRSKTAALHSGV